MCVCVCVCARVRVCVRACVFGCCYLTLVIISLMPYAYTVEKIFTIWFRCAPSIYVVSLTGVHTHTRTQSVLYIHAYTVLYICVVLLLLGNRSVQLSVGL